MVKMRAGHLVACVILGATLVYVLLALSTIGEMPTAGVILAPSSPQAPKQNGSGAASGYAAASAAAAAADGELQLELRRVREACARTAALPDERLPSAAEPLIEYMASSLALPLPASAPASLAGGRAFAETAKQLGGADDAGDEWWWIDDNAKGLEPFVFPSLLRRHRPLVADIVRYVQSLAPGGFFFRRLVAAKLRLVSGAPSAFDVHTGLLRAHGSLDDDRVYLGFRFHDGRDETLACLGGAALVFRLGGARAPLRRVLLAAHSTRTAVAVDGPPNEPTGVRLRQEFAVRLPAGDDEDGGGGEGGGVLVAEVVSELVLRGDAVHPLRRVRVRARRPLFEVRLLLGLCRLSSLPAPADAGRSTPSYRRMYVARDAPSPRAGGGGGGARRDDVTVQPPRVGATGGAWRPSADGRRVHWLALYNGDDVLGFSPAVVIAPAAGGGPPCTGVEAGGDEATTRLYQDVHTVTALGDLPATAAASEGEGEGDDAGWEAGGAAAGTVVVRERLVLLAGGLYHDWPAYDALLREHAGFSPAGAWRAVDLSISYDYGAEMHALSALALAEADGAAPTPPGERAFATGGAVAFLEQKLRAYAANMLRRAHSGGAGGLSHPSVYCRGHAFALVALDNLHRLTAAPRFLRCHERFAAVLAAQAFVVPGTSPPAVLFTLGNQWRAFLDTQLAAIWALARAALLVGAGRRGAEYAVLARRAWRGVRLQAGAGVEARARVSLVFDERWAWDKGEDNPDNMHWSMKSGLLLRAAFATQRLVAVMAETRAAALGQTEGAAAADEEEPVSRALADEAWAWAAAEVQHVEALAAAARAYVARCTRRAPGGGSEVLTSWQAGETNSETQPWVAAGLANADAVPLARTPRPPDGWRDGDAAAAAALDAACAAV